MSTPDLLAVARQGINLPGDQAQAIAAVSEALDAAGLVVVLDIDVQHALAGRFDGRFHPYRYIGAAHLSVAERCQNAQDALLASLQTVIVVYDNGDGSSTAELAGLMDQTTQALAGDNPQAHGDDTAHPRTQVQGRRHADHPGPTTVARTDAHS